jgi:hypothetical protein
VSLLSLGVTTWTGCLWTFPHALVEGPAGVDEGDLGQLDDQLLNAGLDLDIS